MLGIEVSGGGEQYLGKVNSYPIVFDRGRGGIKCLVMLAGG